MLTVNKIDGSLTRPDLNLPVLEKGSDKNKLKETAQDKLLEAWRKLAQQKEKNFRIDYGIVTKIVNDKLGREKDVLGIPKTSRLKILQFAHDRSGHLGARKTQELIADKFVWPFIGKDVTDYCKSCVACQKANKVARRRALMVKRPVVSEPFMSIAFDLVGPLPKGKGGKKYLLTY